MAETEKKTDTAEAKEKTVKIRIPKTKEESGDVFVSVNQRTFQIQRGVEVEVPECVAEVLRHKEEAEEAAWSFEESTSKGE